MALTYKLGFPDPTPGTKRRERREQQAAEVEASQASLRENIAETKRLVGESDKMLKRHRQECEEDEAQPS